MKNCGNSLAFRAVPQLGCTSVIFIEISDFWGRVQSSKVFGACGHHCLARLDFLIPHDMAGPALEVTVMLPMLDDGFGVKEDELTGDKGAVPGELSQESAKWLEKGMFFPQELGSTPAAGSAGHSCALTLSCPMSSFQLGFGSLMRSLGWELAIP